MIADHLLERLARALGRPAPSISEEVRTALREYGWPGNVRELANVLERGMILNTGTVLTLGDLPGFLTSAGGAGPDDLKLARAAFERAHVERVLQKCGGDKRRAAEMLGIDLSSLYRKREES
jgi:DNA-binding NtrC family response regulator